MKLSRLFFPFLFTAFFFLKNEAQTVPPKLAEALQHTFDSMRQVLNVKSLSASLQLPDDAVWAGARGISSLSPLDSVTPEHVYHVGSVHKTVTAACILQLADEGILSLDDSLHEWLDTFQFINPNITIRQLLRHQSGIYDVITDPDFQPAMLAKPDSIWSFENAISSFISPPLFQPGAGWSYSNTNYMLLGMIIEAATNSAYFQECRDRFVTPLGLTSFAMLPFEPLPEHVAHVWLGAPGGGSEDSHDFFVNWSSFHSSAAPAGSYFATAGDMARWMRAFMSGSLHSPAIMQQAKTTVNAFANGTKYGLGLMERKFLGYTGYGHGGDIGYSASVFYFPEKDISIAVLNNDSKNNSWTLIPVVTALLKTYLDCEALLDANEPTKNQPEMQVFPNPFSHQIQVSVELPDSTDEMRWVLTNAQGETAADIRTDEVPAGKQAIVLEELGELPSGIYFLTAFSEGKMAGTVKILKSE